MDFAFYGRVSTEDNQDPMSSRQWQLDRCQQLISPAGGVIVAEYFDIGQSRSLPWKRRPQAAKLLDDIAKPDRPFDAIVIAEPARAFSGNQYSLTFPLLLNYGVELWVPEVGGKIDPDSEAHDMMMGLFGGMSKGERQRIKTRVRSAMSSQARFDGRFLGGRPPYGYRLADTGPHPNPRKAADGKRQYRLEPDPVTAPIIGRIFSDYLAGQSPHSIAEGLNRNGVPSPSGYDPERNPHRQSSHGAWSKSALRAILRNPRYTGYEVWNKQRRDEALFDVQDVALGNKTKMRWNPDEQWIWSEHPVHEAIVDIATYKAVVARFASRTRDRVRKQRSTPRPYVLRGILFCGVCSRRMQGNWNNDVAHYRCRFPQEYALTTEVDHPKNVYLRQDTVVPLLDEWLLGMFDPANIEATCEQMAAAAMAGIKGDDAKRVMAERTLKECDRRLIKCRKLLYEGTDPKIVDEWITEVQGERLGAEQALAALAPAPAVTKDDIRRIVDRVEDKTRMLADADPIIKAALYADLGITLTYEPDRRVVVVEAQPRDLWAKERVGEGT